MRILILATACLSLYLISSCKGKDKQSTTQSENNIDAARNFIRAALDGKFDEARNFMLGDSLNINYMDLAERSFGRAEQAVKDGYRASTIHIHEVKPVNDSTTVVIYSNSFKNDHDTLKVLRINNQWLVDFKYLYQHDSDTTINKPVSKDSLQ